jgi:hypothetical protein
VNAITFLTQNIMTSKLQHISLLCLLVGLLAACQSDKKQGPTTLENILYSLTDSYSFQINGHKDTTLILEESGIIIKIPQGAILKNGKILDNYELSFSPILDPLSMIAHKVVTQTTGGILLKTQGMFYLDIDRKDVEVNPNNPIIIKMPIKDTEERYQTYTGRKNEAGSVVWENPQNSNAVPLTPILTQHFIFRDFVFLDKDGEMIYLIDDINSQWLDINDSTKLVNLSKEWGRVHDKCDYTNGKDAIYHGLYPKTINNDFYNIKYTLMSNDTNAYYKAMLKLSRPIFHPGIGEYVIGENHLLCLNPKWEGTHISTIEFRKRIDWIIASCEPEILLLYFENINQDLWEIDSLAADLLMERGKPSLSEKFRAFQRERAGKVPVGLDTKLVEFPTKAYFETYLTHSFHNIESSSIPRYYNIDIERPGVRPQFNISLDIEDLASYDTYYSTLFLGTTNDWKFIYFSQKDLERSFVFEAIDQVDNVLLVVCATKGEELYTYVSNFPIDKNQTKQNKTIKLKLSSIDAFKEEMKKYNPQRLPNKKKKSGKKVVNDCWIEVADEAALLLNRKKLEKAYQK